MKQFAAIGFTVSICIYTLMHYITYLHLTEIGLLILSCSGIATIIFACIFLPLKSFLIPIFLFVTAIIIQLMSGGSLFTLLMEGIFQMSSLIALLLIVPIIGWILREEPYIDGIMNVAHKMLNTSKKFHMGIMVVNQIISYFLLFGAIPMMYQFINDFFTNKNSEAWEYFKGTALLRSFALTTLWVISIPSFAFALDHLGAPLIWTIVQGFFISLAGIFLSVLFTSYKEKRYGANITADIGEEINKLVHKSNPGTKWIRLTTEFVFIFISLFSTIFILHIVMGWGLLVLIPPMILIWTFAYFFYKGRTKQLVSLSKDYLVNEIKFKSQQFSLLLAAGVLIFSVNQSGFGRYLVDGLFYIEQAVPFLNFLVILPFTVIFLGFLGLGPLTVIVLVAGILQNVVLSYPPELVVLSMTSGSVISIVLSPFILPIIVLSSSNGLSILKNGFGFNLGYATAFYFLVQAYIQFTWHFIY
ncbi:hypothetical protein GH741_14880 [Aquibacillus halophilus]|uniref:Permease n=1 Tax=Aquibacillus halophilus TaxID=930132 RepID=A0A6A8DE04_9BACI|nr:hypothetical protein [Aquibacillus halophilus]MRH43925.1 hypothetical protein [Aquibacillus halophilus]